MLTRCFVSQALFGLSRLFSLVQAQSYQKVLVQDDNGPFTKDFEKLALETLEKWHVPGVAIAVVDGENTWAEGYGIATYPSTPVTPSTLFYGGSTTKAFVDAAISIMMDSGNYSTPPAPNSPSSTPRPLDWRTPIASILPDDFILQDPWATEYLTLEDAGSHRTGMPRHDMALARHYGIGADRHNATVRDVVRMLRYLPLTQEPRSMYQYCNLMYAVLSHVVETLASRWLGDVLKEWIWEPLGMKGTYFSLEDALAAPEHLAMGYYWDKKDGNFKEVPYQQLQEISGAGSVVSNVLDYANWMRCLMNEAVPLSKEGHEAIKTPRIIVSPKLGGYDVPQQYALGWVVTSYKGHRLITHSGGMEAYGAEVYVFPEQKFGVVTFANTGFTSNAVGEILLWHLVDKKLGVPQEQRRNVEKRWENTMKALEGRMEGALDALYPNRAHPPLPPAVPLEKYAGTYYHPGYQNLTLLIPDAKGGKKSPPTLVAVNRDYTWKISMEFQHVSGEYWIMYAELLNSPGSNALAAYAAVEFKVGFNGLVEQVGIEWRDISGQVDGWIWYDRVA